MKGKLHHHTPGWVSTGARFHIRISTRRGSTVQLVNPAIAEALLRSVALYQQQDHWYVWLALIMPDHLHMVASFPGDKVMSRVIGQWKKFQSRTLNLDWQDNYFDHRLRNDAEFLEKSHYIRMNPVRAGLCEKPEMWPWVREPWREAMMDSTQEQET